LRRSATTLPTDEEPAMFRRALAPLICGVLLLSLPAAAAQFDVGIEEDGYPVKIDGKLFTKYLLKSGHKPIFWPIIGPTGQEMTRAHPMRPGNPDEKSDHVHQRSFWFTHGNVNGIDFWSEGSKAGTIEHREFLKVEGGEQAVIVTRNDWMAPDGTRVCEEVRTMTLGATADTRWIDFDTVVLATDGPVKFGDTKEGAFGVRVAGTMKVDAKQGGQIVNSEGLLDGAAWGKPAAWVDYHGPVAGERVGIAILNHPTSFRFPTTWHVRTYGLFAANPFGLHDFPGGANADGSHTIAKGESMKLRYRVLFHKGDEKQAKIADAFAEYAKVKKD
jgi:hypothetical protein